jgi:hypothetical protein
LYDILRSAGSCTCAPASASTAPADGLAAALAPGPWPLAPGPACADWSDCRPRRGSGRSAGGSSRERAPIVWPSGSDCGAVCPAWAARPHLLGRVDQLQHHRPRRRACHGPRGSERRRLAEHSRPHAAREGVRTHARWTRAARLSCDRMHAATASGQPGLKLQADERRPCTRAQRTARAGWRVSARGLHARLIDESALQAWRLLLLRVRTSAGRGTRTVPMSDRHAVGCALHVARIRPVAAPVRGAAPPQPPTGRSAASCTYESTALSSLVRPSRTRSRVPILLILRITVLHHMLRIT